MENSGKKYFVRLDGSIVYEDQFTEEDIREMKELEESWEECWEEERESEIDVARGEGFLVDDDGNWIPMDEDDDWF